MRAQLLVAGVSITGFLLLAVACGTNTTYVYEDAGPGDGTSSGTSGTSGKSSSGGTSGKSSSGDDDDTTTDDDDDDTVKPMKDAGKDSSSSSSGFPTIASTKLADGDDLSLQKLVGDDALYVRLPHAATEATQFFVVPIAGGTPEKIFEIAAGAADQFSVDKGVVAHWHDVASGVGTLDVWTRATGLKANVATGSLVKLIRASADGTRIAFSQDVVLSTDAAPKPVTTSIGIRAVADATNLLTISDPAMGGVVNLAATTTCPARLGFSGNTFIAQFCNGTSATQDLARLVALPGGATALVRIDAPDLGSANTLLGKVAFSADATGAKVVAAANLGANSPGKIYTVATPATGVLTTENIVTAQMASDGARILYRTATGDLKVVKTTEAIPATVAAIATGVRTVGWSPNGHAIVFTKLAADPQTNLTDVNVVDATAATPTPVALVAEAKGAFLGFTGTSSDIVFIDGSTANTLKLKSGAIAGGAAKDLVPTVDLVAGGKPATDGTGFIFYTNLVGGSSGNPTTFDANYIDVATAMNPKMISQLVVSGEILVAGKRVVYTRLSATDAGLYTLTLP